MAPLEEGCGDALATEEAKRGETIADRLKLGSVLHESTASIEDLYRERHGRHRDTPPP